MRELLCQAVQNAMETVRLHEELVGIQNIDESTFRSFVLAELKRLCPEANCQTEWHRVDLLVQANGESAAVEFKWWFCRRTTELNCVTGHWKGGPGVQNEREFWQRVGQLHSECPPGIDRKFIILAYESVRPNPRGHNSFRGSYDDLGPGDKIMHVAPLADPGDGVEGIVCRLIEVR